MEIRPPQGRQFFAPGASASGSPRSGRSNLSETSEKMETKVTQDARQRAEDAIRQLQLAEAEANSRLEYIKEDYGQREVAEATRLESQLNNERNKGYEAIREQQRQNQKELARIRREGEVEVERLKEHYRNALFTQEQSGKQQITDIERTQAKQIEFQTANSQHEQQELKKQQDYQFTRMKEESEHKIGEMREMSAQEYERLRANTAQAQENAEADYTRKVQTNIHEKTEQLSHINQEATRKLNEVRADTSRKLAAYAERQRDPFYQLLRLDAELEDQGDNYVLTARIPEHEQKHVNISVRGNQLVVSGTRRNEEKLNLGPGREISSSAYQSYSESFPLAVPVEAKALQRRFDGDELIVTVPKKSGVPNYQAFQAKRPPKMVADRPHFPENIPHTGPGDKDSETAFESPPNRGSRPIT